MTEANSGPCTNRIRMSGYLNSIRVTIPSSLFVQGPRHSIRIPASASRRYPTFAAKQDYYRSHCTYYQADTMEESKFRLYMMIMRFITIGLDC